MSELSDQMLIQSVVASKSHNAFASLVKRYQSGLRYSLRQITGGDEMLADDIAQETFIKAFKSIAMFNGQSKFSSWLYRIAYNLFISHHRVARNRELPYGDDQPEHRVTTSEGNGFAPRSRPCDAETSTPTAYGIASSSAQTVNSSRNLYYYGTSIGHSKNRYQSR